MRSLHRSLLLAGAAALALSACDSPTGSSEPVPARLDIVSGDLQTQTVGKELAQPLVVKVLDSKGKAVEDQIINFRVTAGNGSVFAGSALTDGNGEARERWTLGTVAGDTQRVEARAVDPSTGAALVFATFRAVGTADVPTSIAAAGASAFTGLPLLPLADSVAAVARDVYGNPVPGATVVWTVKQGGGSASPVNTTTGPAGVARTRWTLGGQLDSLQVLEAAAGLTVKTQFTANGHVPADVVVLKLSGDAQTGAAGHALAQPLVVRVQRANGTPVQGIPVSFTLPAGAGSVTPATAVSDASGQVSVQWTLGTGTGAMSATAAIANGASAAFSATSAAGPAASLQKVSGDAQEGRAGTLLADSLTVRARDEFGNAVSGVTITWSAPSGSVSPATGVTRADGTTRTAYTLPSAGGPATVQAAATGVAPVTFTEVAKASAVYITILQPAPNTRTGDQVLVSARVDSSNASVASVKARAGGQTVALTPFSGTELRGTLDLRSAPSGPLQLVVVGTTVNGDSGTAEVPIVHDAPPTLNVTAPLMGTVARPSVRIDVDCVDAAGPCQSVMASLTSLPFSGTVVASGTTGIHADVSLAAYDGHDWILELRGTDSSGQVVYRELDLVVESSSHLTEVFSGGENLVDFDATRALTQKQAFSHNTGGEYVPWEIRLLDRSTGVETPLASGANLRGKFGTNRNLYPGRLHTNGAIFLAAPCWCDWRAGSLDTLDYTVVFEGDLAAYGNTVRNLATGAESTVPGLFATDVAVNGDVVGLGNYDVVRYRGGTLTPLTSDGASGGPTYVSPLTDGINVAAVRKGGGPTSLRVITTSGSADFGLSASSIPEGLWPHRAYEVENGWTAWLQEDAGAIAQVWVRSPAGVVKQVTSVGQSAAIAALGPNGEVLYTAGGVAYLAQYPYTAAAVRVFSAAYPFEARWSGGDLLMFTGRTAFRVTY